jgi:hypothetical protein
LSLRISLSRSSFSVDANFCFEEWPINLGFLSGFADLGFFPLDEALNIT